MNIKSIAPAFLVAAFMCSCEFNEDFCIREGILYATCDYSNISSGTYIDPSNQHLIGYGKSDHTLSVYETADFVSDTLEWIAPQGDYDFLLYSGKEGYDIAEREDIQSCQAVAQTKMENDKEFYSSDLPLISYSIFSGKLVYQQPLTKKADMKPLTQEIIVKLHLEGNQLHVLDSIYSELGGVSKGKTFVSHRNSKESVLTRTIYEKYDSSKRLWTGSSNVIGISDTDKNIFRLYTKTTNNSDEIYEFDLSPYLKGIKEYKIIVNLDLVIGRELELNTPVIVESWETGGQHEIELKPVQ